MAQDGVQGKEWQEMGAQGLGCWCWPSLALAQEEATKGQSLEGTYCKSSPSETGPDTTRGLFSGGHRCLAVLLGPSCVEIYPLPKSTFPFLSPFAPLTSGNQGSIEGRGKTVADAISALGQLKGSPSTRRGPRGCSYLYV